MSRYLVVANKTVTSEQLAEVLTALSAEPGCEFHLVVPEEHPTRGMWSDGQVRAAATARAAEAVAHFAALGVAITAEAGDVNPVRAVGDVLRRDEEHFDGIIVSTLPKGPSRWLHFDVPTRLGRAFGLPITHVMAEPALV